MVAESQDAWVSCVDAGGACNGGEVVGWGFEGA
jgi:hypothetical protein